MCGFVCLFFFDSFEGSFRDIKHKSGLETRVDARAEEKAVLEEI